MNVIEQGLQKLNITLPKAVKGVGAYKSWAIFGDNIICTSGQLPWVNGKIAYEGQLGKDLTIEQGYQCARLCGIHAIAQLKEAAGGDLSRIKQIIRIEGNVQTADGFYDHAQVLNGASELFNDVFGERGIHTRTAQGMISSPLNAGTLIYAFAELEK